MRAGWLFPGTWRRHRLAACSTKLFDDVRRLANAVANRLGQFQPSVPLLTSRYDPMLRGRVVQPVEVILRRLPGLRGVDEDRRKRRSNIGESEIDDGSKFGRGHLSAGSRLRASRAPHQATAPGRTRQRSHGPREQRTLNLTVPDIEGLDIASTDLLEDAVADAFAKPIPDDNIFERLALVVGGAGRVHHDDEVRRVLR